MAARSHSKLEVLRSDLAKINPAMKVNFSTRQMKVPVLQKKVQGRLSSGAAAVLKIAQQLCLHM